MCKEKERFTIRDVLNINNIKILREDGNQIQTTCPHCGAGIGKFYVNDAKGVCYCQKCTFSANAIGLHIECNPYNDYFGEDGRKNAAKDIFAALNGDIVLQKMHDDEAKRDNVSLEIERRSDEYISEVYYKMLRMLPLRDEHKADLIRRGLTEKEIKRYRFASTPKDRRGICKKLVALGYDLEGVPGFYVDKTGKWNMNVVGEGYFCPVYDGEKNLLIGFQIRLDNPTDGNKYKWFSSNGREKGCSSSAITTCLPGKNDNVLIVVEGILKATVVYSLLDGAVTVLGVPGIQSLKGLKSYLRRYEGIAYVYEAYDMDKLVRTDDPKEQEKTERIYEAAIKLQEMIKEYNLECHPLKWDYDSDGLWKGQYKGLDDFLLGYERKDLFVKYISDKANTKIRLRKYFLNT